MKTQRFDGTMVAFGVFLRLENCYFFKRTVKVGTCFSKKTSEKNLLNFMSSMHIFCEVSVILFWVKNNMLHLFFTPPKLSSSN